MVNEKQRQGNLFKKKYDILHKQVIQFLKHKPLFLFLLPLFFVLHGFTRNYYAVPAGEALLLLLLYTICAFTITGIAWLFYRDLIKAALLSLMIIAYEFFFGNLQDMLKSISPQSFISQYRFILPMTIAFFIFFILCLKRRKSPLLKLNSYLNILLLVLIMIDSGWLISKISGEENNMAINTTMDGRTIPDSCTKPDIYLLLMDQYAGSTALSTIFHFDNTPFLNELNHRGFHIALHSRSNYNLTPVSMASFLSMNYLAPESTLRNKLNISYCYQVIRNSAAIRFLTTNGYKFYNSSVFDFPDQPAHKYTAFLPYGIKLITANTFTGRLKRDLRSSIADGKFGLKSLREKIVYEYLHFNDSTFEFTRNLAAKREPQPKFVYAHFMLPHFPYYFNSNGSPLPLNKLTDHRRTNSNDYIEYLKFGNKKILRLVDDILANSPTPPVIMLLSDHGSRNPIKEQEHTNDFVNLNAIYIPDRNYGQFYDSISNVNQLRVLFNSCLDQQLPLLKDSTIDVAY